MIDNIEDAITDALLHHNAELAYAGMEPLDPFLEAFFGVGFMQGARWAATGDWRLNDE